MFFRSLSISDCYSMCLCIKFIRVSGVINGFLLLYRSVSGSQYVVNNLLLSMFDKSEILSIVIILLVLTLEGFIFIVLSLKPGCLFLMAVLVAQAILLLMSLSGCLLVLIGCLVTCVSMLSLEQIVPFSGLPLFLLLTVGLLTTILCL